MPSFEESKVFTVNILRDDQEELSRKFAVSGGDKFTGVAYQARWQWRADSRPRHRMARM